MLSFMLIRCLFLQNLQPEVHFIQYLFIEVCLIISVTATSNDSMVNDSATPGPKGMFSSIISPSSKRGALSSSSKPGRFVKNALEFTDRSEFLVISCLFSH